MKSSEPLRFKVVKFLAYLILLMCLITGSPGFQWAQALNLRFPWLPKLELLISVITLGYMALQLFLAYVIYRPHKSPGDDELPTCAVIVPAYNEGAGVLFAINSVLASNYPKDKFFIIAVDDGSTDNTWKYIEQAAKLADGRVIPVRQPRNQGKRHAIRRAIDFADAEVVVTVDSDSEVKADTLRNLVAPFQNPRVGAVAGNIRVRNINSGMLPHFMDVNFAFNFEIMRAGQSTIGTVFCTPGALSAYRKSVLLPCVDEWANQKFLGHPAGIGEDRALANYVLKQGYKIKFQRDAIAYTQIPCDFVTLCKMFMRWGRGDFRETILMYLFVFKPIYRTDFAIALRFTLLLQTLWLLTPILMFPILLFGLFASPINFLISMTWITSIWGAMPTIVYAINANRREAIWGNVYAFVSLLFLFWMMPFCLLTIGNSGWLTRQKKREVVTNTPTESTPIIYANGSSDEKDAMSNC